MRMRKVVQTDAQTTPDTRSDLHQWVRDRLPLSTSHEQALLEAIDHVFMQHERLWQQSKQEAIQAVSAGFTERLNRLRDELTARDPKTRLMNFRRFVEQLEAFLALEQRGRWCAVGLVDITSFKWYNDTLGHATGDKIIDRVARLLREQVRGEDLLAQESGEQRTAQELHARFGGDEFCFLIPDLDEFSAAWVIAERFREAVQRYDWIAEDPRLIDKPVNVDVGVVCLALGRVTDRRPIARKLAHDLLATADKLMYQAKSEGASQIHPVRVQIVDGELVELGADEHPEETSFDTSRSA
jgi:diguanylate cyclase (GGDEF)-like protein